MLAHVRLKELRYSVLYALCVTAIFRAQTPHFVDGPGLGLILLSDLAGIVLFLIAETLLEIFFLIAAKITKANNKIIYALLFLLRLVLGFGFAAIWILSRRYFALYEVEFSWIHLGQEGLDPNLWLSLASEFDRNTRIELIGAWAGAFAYAFFSMRGTARDTANSQESSKEHIIYYVFRFVVLFGMAMMYFAFWGRQMHPLLTDEGNILCRLLYLPRASLHLHSMIEDRESRKQANTLQAKEASVFLKADTRQKAKSSFHYGFDTTSLTETDTRPAIPFAGRGRRLNFVLYVLESTSYRYMGATDPQGTALTPNWDRLSQKAIVFERHYAQNPLSINALFNLLTSAYPLPADRWAAKDYPKIPLPSIPSILKTYNYKSAVYHGGYFAYAGAGAFLEHRSFDERLDVKKLPRNKFPKLNWGIDDRAYIEPAINFARNARDLKQNFFIMFLPITPHHPYESPPETPKMKIPESLRDGRGQSFRRYLRALHYADAVLGKTIESFEKSGLAQNTVFFVLADHGEAFGQHRKNYNHPFYIYEENVHVPFLIYAPSFIRKQIRVKRITRHIDVFPTMLGMLNIPSPKTVEGISVLKQSRGQFAPLHTTWRHSLVGLRDGRYKYIYNKRTQRSELYDLALDPKEKNSIAQERPDLTKTFLERLRKLEDYQKQYFETVLGKNINWKREQKKENF